MKIECDMPDEERYNLILQMADEAIDYSDIPPINTARILNIHTFYDSEAEVWVVDDSDLPGLVTEAETLDELTKKLKNIIPELIELNQKSDFFEYPLYFLCKIQSR